jgi:hypothetical protein
VCILSQNHYCRSVHLQGVGLKFTSLMYLKLHFNMPRYMRVELNSEVVVKSVYAKFYGYKLHNNNSQKLASTPSKDNTVHI